MQASLFGRGQATSVPLEAGGFLRTRPELDIPDVHVTFVPGLSLAATQAGQGRHGSLVNVYQLRPHSRGEVRLASPHPASKPVIDPRYLTAEADRQCLRGGVVLARKLMSGPALAAYSGEELQPGDSVQAEGEVDRWVAATANTIFHPVGTCRMGVDEGAVLDASLKVRGIAGLRVADASAMPQIIGGNTAAPTMMIASKVAELLRDSG